MLFGDSITQGGWEEGGFGHRLSRMSILHSAIVLGLRYPNVLCYTDLYSRKLDVLNRGFSGYNTDWAVPVFEQVRIPNAQSRGSAPDMGALLNSSSQRSTSRSMSLPFESSPSGSVPTMPA